MWPPSQSAPKRSLPTGTVLGVNWATGELRTLGEALLRPASSSLRYETLRHFGLDPSRADEFATAYRLGGTAALAQAFEAARVDP